MIREDEFNEILEANKMFSEQLDRLKAENARLRGALENIATLGNIFEEKASAKVAREALEKDLQK